MTNIYINNEYKEELAGGIIIDPWSNINDPNKYNILIIKQKIGNKWGLPKGHCEINENIENGAIREIREETGIDFNELEEGIDYLKINYYDYFNNYGHSKNIKKITFFMYVLLKRGYLLKKYKMDTEEIKDATWINIPRLTKLCNKNIPNFKRNRTLTIQTLNILQKICFYTQQFLINVIKNN
jgi:tRNA nucleotidyltransferase (CCA-adding enzyme)